jgi:hypothetical protein
MSVSPKKRKAKITRKIKELKNQKKDKSRSGYNEDQINSIPGKKKI